MFFSRDFSIFCLTLILILFFLAGAPLATPQDKDLTYAKIQEYTGVGNNPHLSKIEEIDSWITYIPPQLSHPVYKSIITSRKGASHLSKEEGGNILSTEENINYWIDRLNFLNSPIEGAKISHRDSQLPNAPRPYRNGVHHGLDYYYDYCGVDIRIGTPVKAAGEGTVIRIDHDYEELTREEREELLAIAAEDSTTPEEVLDKLRGRQIWIQHQDNIVTRYVHLHSTCPELQVGDKVKPRQYIGEIGNSGTSHGVEDSSCGAHLHFEIWIDEEFFGHNLEVEEIRAVLEEVLQ